MAILDLIYSAREISQVPAQIASRMSLATDTNTSEYRSIQYAVKRYSLLRPRKLGYAFLSTGAKQYDLTTAISGFVPTSFSVTDVIYPYNDDDSSYINMGFFDNNKWDRQDWRVVKNPLDSNKAYLRFFNNFPGESATLKIVLLYDSPHLVDATNDTITSEEPLDTEAFSYLVASRILFIASNYFARLDDATVDISVVDNQLKSNTYKQRSKDAFETFMEHMNDKVEHSGRIDWDHFTNDSEEMLWRDSRIS